MIFTTVITPAELYTLIQNEKQCGSDSLLILDCRSTLADPDIGRKLYDEKHIPLARYIHFDRMTSGKVAKGTGRHPMPEKEVFVEAMRSVGVGNNRQIVIYDQGGLGFAPRLWYQLRWAGYEKVAVLDGGFKAWDNGWRPVTKEEPAPVTGDWTAGDALETPVEMAEIQKNLESKELLIVDARPVARFHGENETIDHKAGHIPGSVARCGCENLTEDGRLKSAKVLREEWLGVLDGRKPVQIVHSCGSGVNACLNLLAMDYCGLFGARLYPGSWSQWIDFEENPIEVP